MRLRDFPAIYHWKKATWLLWMNCMDIDSQIALLEQRSVQVKSIEQGIDNQCTMNAFVWISRLEIFGLSY